MPPLAAPSLILSPPLPLPSPSSPRDAFRTPLPAPVKVKLGMLNVPALSPLWLLPDTRRSTYVQMEP